MFVRIDYGNLNGRQKENYNFHKVAARLADYGYNSLRLSDDFHGADFIALHVNGEDLLRVQLKSRVVIDGKYEGKGIYVAFLDGDRCYVYPHDVMVARIEALDTISNTSSWRDQRAYYWPYVPGWLRAILSEYEI